MKHPDSDDYTVGIAGCGAMGQGIAQVSALGGMQTRLYDARDGGAVAAKDRVSGHINRLVEKGRIGEDAAQAAIDRLVPVTSLSELAPCDTVVEAIFEDLEVKQALFKELEGVVGEACIIASNTSSIPLASIARACTHRGRIAGLHFFNPVPLMKLVEVIRAAETDDNVIEALMALGRRMTRTPVEVKDSPGFLVNMGGRAYTTEANRIEHESVATPEQVDAIMRDCWGFRMGPFELMDLTGIDVNYPVSGIVYRGYNEDPRLKTSANHMAKFDAGLFGRKTGRGWYAYEKMQPLDRPSADHVPQAAANRSVQLLQPSEALLALVEDLGLIAGDSGPVLAAPVGVDATTTAIQYGIDHRTLMCIDTLGNTSRRVTVMTAPGADRAALEALVAAMVEAGRAVTWINDSPGFVGPRMVAMIANLGCYMAEIGLASPEDIDTAMQLGLNYPHGSIAFAAEVGEANILRILTEAQRITGEDRYRPTLWLKRRAMLGLGAHTPN